MHWLLSHNTRNTERAFLCGDSFLLSTGTAQTRRVADLCSGNGLLSWLLLLMDDNTVAQPRTAICVDRAMPISADRVASAMREEFPHLSGRWSYAEMSIDEVEASSACLLTALHACGVLTDKVRANDYTQCIVCGVLTTLSVLSELRVVESISAVNDGDSCSIH